MIGELSAIVVLIAVGLSVSFTLSYWACRSTRGTGRYDK